MLTLLDMGLYCKARVSNSATAAVKLAENNGWFSVFADLLLIVKQMNLEYKKDYDIDFSEEKFRA